MQSQDVGNQAVDAGTSAITSLEKYLSGRKQLISGRDALFVAARSYLRPGQRPDARVLGDRLWNSPARDIADDEWVVNATRGYLTIMENPGKGRPFRLCVLQQGYDLLIGLRLTGVEANQNLRDRVWNAFIPKTPTTTQLTTGEVLVNWHFSAEQLYTEAQAMEDAVYRIGALFEAALQAFSFQKVSS